MSAKNAYQNFSATINYVHTSCIYFMLDHSLPHNDSSLICNTVTHVMYGIVFDLSVVYKALLMMTVISEWSYSVVLRTHGIPRY